MARRVEDAPLVALAPEHQAAVHAAAARRFARERVETPEFAPGRGVEGEQFKLGGSSIEDSAHDQGIALDLAVLGDASCMKGPGRDELGHIAAVDLIEGGVVRPFRVAKVNRPVVAGRGKNRAADHGQRCIQPRLHAKRP